VSATTSTHTRTTAARHAPCQAPRKEEADASPKKHAFEFVISACRFPLSCRIERISRGASGNPDFALDPMPPARELR
jgi:hypothetical protein